jgi:hypothetical protein
MIEGIRYPILRFAGSEVKRVQHMERSGEPFPGVGIAFEGFRGIKGSHSHRLRQFLRFLPR